MALGFMVPGVDSAAHVGGLLGGFLATISVGLKHKSSKFEMFNGFIALVIYIIFLFYIGLFR